jgi:hypothetical protein
MVTMCLILWFKLDYRLVIQHTLVVVGVFWNAIGAGSLASSGCHIVWYIPYLLIIWLSELNSETV